MERPTGRQRKLQIMVYLTQDLLEKLEVAARMAGMSRSGYINAVLERHIKLMESQPGH